MISIVLEIKFQQNINRLFVYIYQTYYYIKYMVDISSVISYNVIIEMWA